jgi:D-sedoheptulose 7-phosphate isomerase
MKVQQYLSSLQETIQQLPVHLVEQLIDILQEARLAGRQVFIMGNGGSASTASHFVCDLAKNTRREGWPHFKVIGLTDNMAIFSAYANDEGYENVFAQQLASLVKRGDLVIAISASGNSPNVVKALEMARQHEAKTIGFTGFKGGKMAELVDLHINIPNNSYEQVEDVHLMLEHMTVSALKDRVANQLPPQIPPPLVTLPSPEADSISLLFGQPTRVAEMAERNQKSMDLLYTITAELAEKLNLHDLLERILLLTLESVGAASGSIVVLDVDGCVIEGAMAYEGQVHSRTTQQLADILSHGLAGWVVENRQAVLIPSTRDDPRWLPRIWEEGKSRSALSVPLMAHERVVGVLTMVHPEVDRFTREDMALLTAVALTVSVNGETRLLSHE